MEDRPRRFLRLNAVKQRLSLGRTAIYAKIKAGELRTYPLGARAIGFLESDIDAWIESRIRATQKGA